MSDDKNIEFALWAMGIAKQNRQKALDKMPYNEYLKTDEWQQKRKAAHKKAGGYCQNCGRLIRNTTSDTHHLRYAPRGKEAQSDLIVLCRDCHRKTHGIK